MLLPAAAGAGLVASDLGATPGETSAGRLGQGPLGDLAKLVVLALEGTPPISGALEPSLDRRQALGLVVAAVVGGHLERWIVEGASHEAALDELNGVRSGFLGTLLVHLDV